MENNIRDSYKVCYSCKLEQPTEVPACLECGKTAFAHNRQVEARKSYLQFQSEIIESLPKVITTEPEFKECLMCAEPIRFKAKKCRYCGEMQEE